MELQDHQAWMQLHGNGSVHRSNLPSELCDTLAAIARRLITCFVDPSGLSAFVACRLIALDKCPGVRPIGIGETVRRIIGKAIAITITKTSKKQRVLFRYVQVIYPYVKQLCMPVYQSQQTEAVILADASNTFNSLNREAALSNIQQLCPSLSKVIIEKILNSS